MNLHPLDQRDAPIVIEKGTYGNHVFFWLETPDGTKWAAKNPKKATKTLKLKEKLSCKKNTAKKAPTNDSSHTTRNIDNIQHGAWVMEDHAFISVDNL